MGHRRSYFGNALRSITGLAAITAVGAAAYTVRKIYVWSKDEYATELWLRGCGKGVIISKGSEPHTYQVRTGFGFSDDVPTSDIAGDLAREPEMELDITDVESGVEV